MSIRYVGSNQILTYQGHSPQGHSPQGHSPQVH